MPRIQLNIELLPCPFCGTVPQIIQPQDPPDETDDRVVISCEGDCRMMVFTGWTNIQDAARAWNTRAPQKAEA